MSVRFRKKTPLTIIALACLSLGLGGCMPAHNVFSNDSPQLVAEPDKVSAMLADAADRASRSLETLAAVEHAQTPTVPIAPVDQVPLELRRPISVNWVGPVEALTKTLADRASYSYVTLGSSPPVPLVVSIDAENTPLLDVLRSVGLQLGFQADLKVDAHSKTIEIHYAPNSGAKAPEL